MKKRLIVCAALLIATGFTAKTNQSFDPNTDARIGDETARACVKNPRKNSRSGHYINIGDFDAFVTGARNERFLLVFSPGCTDLDFGESIPVFRNNGDKCQHRGELVQTTRLDTGFSGSCTIRHIYEWDRGENDDSAHG